VGCEETELCIRVHQRWPDLEVRYEPEARVAHTVSADRATLRYFVSRCRAEGLSKAIVSGLVGPGDGAALERAYVRRTLPAGMARAFGQALRGRASPWRALVIPLGLIATAAGYAAAAARGCRTSTTPTASPPGG
jgi:hypothetical protein